jgi:hypothetical protein
MVEYFIVGESLVDHGRLRHRYPSWKDGMHLGPMRPPAM